MAALMQVAVSWPKAWSFSKKHPKQLFVSVGVINFAKYFKQIYLLFLSWT